MNRLETIAEKIRSDVRIAPDEALVLWHEAPLWLLGQLATERKRRVSGDKVFYNRNIHLEPTNRCVFNCRFCSYRRPKESPEAWDYSMEEVERNIRERDKADMSRAVSPLRRADDAIVLDNSCMTVDEQMAWFMEEFAKVCNRIE